MYRAKHQLLPSLALDRYTFSNHFLIDVSSKTITFAIPNLPYASPETTKIGMESLYRGPDTLTGLRRHQIANPMHLPKRLSKWQVYVLPEASQKQLLDD